MEVDPCSSCPVCDGSWAEMHLPIYKSELIRFFESSTGRTVFPLQYNAKTPLTLVFSKRPYWVEHIFDRAACGIRVRQIEALLLSLIAAHIVCLEKTRAGVFQWNLVWRDNSTPAYKDDSVWDGVNLFRDTGTARRRVVTLRE